MAMEKTNVGSMRDMDSMRAKTMIVKTMRMKTMRTMMTMRTKTLRTRRKTFEETEILFTEYETHQRDL